MVTYLRGKNKYGIVKSAREFMLTVLISRLSANFPCETRPTGSNIASSSLRADEKARQNSMVGFLCLLFIFFYEYTQEPFTFIYSKTPSNQDYDIKSSP